MNSAAMISNQGGQLCTVTRYAAGEYVEGYYVNGVTSEFETVIAAQPLNGAELLNLPEGQRGRNVMKGYCADQLFTAQQSPSKKADQVLLYGVMFEVQESQTWTSKNLGHWKLRLVQVNP